MKKEIDIEILIVNNEHFAKGLSEEQKKKFYELSNMAYELGKKDAKKSDMNSISIKLRKFREDYKERNRTLANDIQFNVVMHPLDFRELMNGVDEWISAKSMVRDERPNGYLYYGPYRVFTSPEAKEGEVELFTTERDINI